MDEYPDEINHLIHPKHPLTLILLEKESGVLCGLCGEPVKKDEKYYGCSICDDSSMHLDCAMKPLPPHVSRLEIHEHPLTLLHREVSFACNACGIKGEAFPYVCLSCGFMIHGKCIDLPRVIRINRHLHRISHSFSLDAARQMVYNKNTSATSLPDSAKKLDCGVCRKGIDGRYGAYLSQIDPDFAVHSRCAILSYVWDGQEIKGVPEEKSPPGQPFEICTNGIKHYRHEEHELSRITGVDDMKSRCYACNLHVYPDPFYKCVEEHCGFILHETCANLPLETWSPIHQHTLTLFYKMDDTSFKCGSCENLSNGFRYTCSLCHFDVDSKCVSVKEPFLHGGHPHPLYLDINSKICCVCNKEKPNLLSCDDCKFALCLACATLPSRLLYEDDVHPLFINHGVRATGASWCDCCETQIDPSKNFYECFTSCGTNVHTECTTGGDLRNLRVGTCFYINRETKCQVSLNDQVNRPICSYCISLCLGPSILRCYNNFTCFCSLNCLGSAMKNNLD